MQNLYKPGMDFLNKAFDDAFSNIVIFFLDYELALAVFWLLKKRDLKTIFGYPVLFALLTVFNPYLMIPVADKIGLSSRIRRIFWLLPVNLVLAFAIVCLVYRFTRRWKQAAALALFLILAAAAGECQLPHMVPAENIYKISDESIAIADMIEEDAQTSEPKRCLFADIQLLELRQYNPSIYNTIRRKDILNWSMNPADPSSVEQVLNERSSHHILTMLLYYGVPVESDILKRYVRRFHIRYIIPNKEKGLDGYFEEMGYDEIGETEHFTVWRVG